MHYLARGRHVGLPRLYPHTGVYRILRTPVPESTQSSKVQLGSTPRYCSEELISDESGIYRTSTRLWLVHRSQSAQVKVVVVLQNQREGYARTMTWLKLATNADNTFTLEPQQTLSRAALAYSPSLVLLLVQP